MIIFFSGDFDPKELVVIIPGILSVNFEEEKRR